MFRSKTVFVIGAGASCEFGLPLGAGLANIIREKMDLELDSVGNLFGSGDRQLVSMVQSTLNCGWNDIVAAADRLRQGLPLRKSVDDFLDIHREDNVLMTLGKAAILKAIIETERNSTLAYSPDTARTVDFQRNVETWLAKLVKMLGPTGPEAIVDNAVFVSFNYDRTIEFFLTHALQALYGYDERRSSQTVDRIRIVHPYGTVDRASPGRLDFQRGAVPSDRECVRHAGSIRTYTEEAESGGIAKIHEVMKDAKQIVFLGFGFHDQNLKLLTPPDQLVPAQVFATANGIPYAEHDLLKAKIGSMFTVRPGITLFGGTCAQLFDNYWFTFSQL